MLEHHVIIHPPLTVDYKARSVAAAGALCVESPSLCDLEVRHGACESEGGQAHLQIQDYDLP